MSGEREREKPRRKAPHHQAKLTEHKREDVSEEGLIEEWKR